MKKNFFSSLEIHKKPVKAGLVSISILQADRWALRSGKTFVPGQKICRACWRSLQTLSANDTTSSSTSTSTESETEFFTHSTMDAAVMNTSFELCSVSPLKQHGKSKKTQVAEACRKILKTANILLGKIDQQSRSVEICEKQHDHLTQDDKEKIEHSDQLCEAIDEKMHSADKITKLQLLTLIPDTWSVEKAAQHFGVNNYQVKKARKLKKRILSRPEKKKSRALSEETKQLVINFYQDEEFTRIMPGKKDIVSLSRNVHKQKRLVLYNLKKLFCTFKTRYPSTQIGFSSFCILQPKWCV